MTEIEKKALALLNEVNSERNYINFPEINREWHAHEALCRAIEQRHIYLFHHR